MDRFGYAAAADTSVPDALLPDQYFERIAGSVREMPEKRLMAAVLLDAVLQLQRDGSSAAAEVRAWIAGRGSRGVFSFANICDALGLEPTYLARGLEAKPKIAPRRVRLVRRRIRVGRRHSTG